MIAVKKFLKLSGKRIRLKDKKRFLQKFIFLFFFLRRISTSVIIARKKVITVSFWQIVVTIISSRSIFFFFYSFQQFNAVVLRVRSINERALVVVTVAPVRLRLLLYRVPIVYRCNLRLILSFFRSVFLYDTSSSSAASASEHWQSVQFSVSSLVGLKRLVYMYIIYITCMLVCAVWRMWFVTFISLYTSSS